MDEHELEQQPGDVRNTSRMAMVARYCGCGGFVLPLLGPLMLLAPFVCITGIVTGSIELVRAYRNPDQHPEKSQTWISLSMSTVSFILFGLFFAQLYNYVQTPIRRQNLRELGTSLQVYIQNHDGYIPTSSSAISLPPERRFYKRYYFYFLHIDKPYLYNGYLAGKKIETIANPERTIAFAKGKNKTASVFYNLADLDLHEGTVVFLDGRSTYCDEWTITKRFPANGIPTSESWFIKPITRP